MMERRTEESIAAFRRAVELNPNSAKAHGDLGRALAFAGQDREAIAQAEDAIRLSPLDPEMALFLGGDRGRALWRRAIRGGGPVHSGSTVAVASRVFRARNGCAAQAWPRPGASMKRDRFLRWYVASSRSFRSIGSGLACPTRRPELMERFLEGMRKAGLNDA